MHPQTCQLSPTRLAYNKQVFVAAVLSVYLFGLATAHCQPIYLKSDTNTLAAALWVTNQDELLVRLDSGATSGLTFIPPCGAPRLNCQHGLYRVAFTLPFVSANILPPGPGQSG